MKHLVLVPLYPPVRYGGIEIISERLCTAMAGQDEVVVLAVAPHGSTIEHRWRDGVEIWEVPGHFFSPLSADSANANVLEVSRSRIGAPDIIHCHDWFLADAAVTLAKRGAPLVGYFHTVKSLERSCLGEPITSARRYSEEKQLLLAKHADPVAVYSDYMRAAATSVFGLEPGRVVQFRCGPTLPLHTGPIHGGQPEAGIRITYIGRLAAEKGVDLLVDAFGALSETQPQHWLRLLGAGPMAESLFGRARNNVGRDRIAFAPFTNDSASLVRVFGQADVVVVPSRFEPYGLVAAEALEVGVPVAVADTGGLPEVVNWGEFGMLFPPDNVDALESALAVVAANRDEMSARATAGRARRSDPASWQRAAATVLQHAAQADVLEGAHP
jgi:glycogen(starch) synthase